MHGKQEKNPPDGGDEKVAAHPPGAAEKGSGGSKDAREGRSNQSNDGSGTSETNRTVPSGSGADGEEDDSSQPQAKKVDPRMMTAAHAVLKEADKELAEVKKHDDSKMLLGKRRRLMGSVYGGANEFMHNVLERVAAAAHVTFSKENIPTIRAIVKAFPGEGRFEAFLLLALDQWERALPADPNADLTMEALAK